MLHKAFQYLFFVIFNFLLICILIYLFTPGEKHLFEPVLLSMYAVALVLIVAQYPLLIRSDSWLKKIVVFYSSMFLFLALSGLVFSWNTAVGSNAAGTWAARLDGSFRFVFFGHIFGAWSFPLVVFANWLLRNWFFEPLSSVAKIGQ